MDKLAPIGVFDSGVGGLSVLTEIVSLLPNESIVYYADSAHNPYGLHQASEIIEYSEAIVNFLLSKSVKLIVVACNTATGIAIHHLRDTFGLPFVGMEPAIKPAVQLTKTGVIGVLATAPTIEAEHFRRTKNQFAHNLEVKVTVGTGLVELVEQGKAVSKESKVLLTKYLKPMIDDGIDQLVLGCTHYPFLIQVMREILPPEVKIHNPAPAVAMQVQRVLDQQNGLNPEEGNCRYSFFSSGDRKELDKLIDEILPG
ncbi:MAG: glutamate racemase [Bacteroidales bacterium]|nr:glutamate racemase [Bacteroidales bacterium]